MTSPMSPIVCAGFSVDVHLFNDDLLSNLVDDFLAVLEPPVVEVVHVEAVPDPVVVEEVRGEVEIVVDEPVGVVSVVQAVASVLA